MKALLRFLFSLLGIGVFEEEVRMISNVALPFAVTADSSSYYYEFRHDSKGAEYVELALTIEDAENENEGELFLNMQPVATLFADQRGEDSEKVVLKYRIEKDLFIEGINELMFQYTGTWGFVIHEIKFTSRVPVAKSEVGASPMPEVSAPVPEKVAKPILKLGLKSLPNYQKGRVQRNDFVRDEFKINNKLVKRGAHPSTRYVSKNKRYIVFGDSFLVFNISGLINTRGKVDPVGFFKVPKGEKIIKAEFHPYVNRETDYLAFTDKGNLYHGALDGTINLLFNLNNVSRRYGREFSEVVTGRWELGLASDEGLCPFYATEKGTDRIYVFSFSLASLRFSREAIEITLRNGQPDYIGAIGKSSAVLKNIKQGSSNWLDPYDLFTINLNVDMKHRQSQGMGMYHATGVIVNGEDYVVDVANHWTRVSDGLEFTRPQDLQNSRNHAGRVWGLDGCAVFYGNMGDIIICDLDGGIYAGREACEESYIGSFFFEGALYAVVTKAFNDVFIRRVT